MKLLAIEALLFLVMTWSALADRQLRLVDCSQSSTEHGGACGRAIDGNTNQQWGGSSCTHTDYHNNEWWQARTAKLVHIKQVRIFNRLDCCSDRLNDFIVTVDGHECASYRSSGFFSVHTFSCDRIGQVVSVRNRKKGPLTLCELQVFGEEVSLPALGGQLQLLSCSQSSTEHGGVCGRAIDGNTNQQWGGSSCTHTDYHKNEWWQARTAKLAHIKQIRIFNRLDCCSDRLNDFIVTVDGHECASYRSSRFFSVHTFNCDRIGQVVSVRNRKTGPLTLCELQVFGEMVKKEVPKPKFKYLGCFTDNNEWRDFPVMAARGSMTHVKCNGLCAKRTTAFFALQNGSECWCGDNYGSNGGAKESSCNVPCSGDKDDRCGGEMNNAVFEVATIKE